MTTSIATMMIIITKAMNKMLRLPNIMMIKMKIINRNVIEKPCIRTAIAIAIEGLSMMKRFVASKRHALALKISIERIVLCRLSLKNRCSSEYL
jgi:hypothetical protein